MKPDISLELNREILRTFFIFTVPQRKHKEEFWEYSQVGGFSLIASVETVQKPDQDGFSRKPIRF